MLDAIVRRLLKLRQAHRIMAVERMIRTRITPLNRLAKLSYARFRRRQLETVLRDDTLVSAFRRNRRLPSGYGLGMDERIVEYPWVLSRMREGSLEVLDAGSTLNFEWIASAPMLRDKRVVCYTLAPEGTLGKPNYSYVYGDLRSTDLRSESFDVVVCISTLEHVGMDNTVFYTQAPEFGESDSAAYRAVLHEFRRVLVPGGRLLLTVPYGAYQDLGWLQQFDRTLLADAIAAFGGRLEDIAYYKHTRDGWQIADAEDCADTRFLYVRSEESPALTVATAAGAVACLELARS